MTDLFERLAPVARRLAPFAGAAHRPFDTVVERVLGPTRVVIGGRETLMLGANNYLGLSFDPGVLAAARDALAQGAGTTGSRVANGTTALHLDLERAFAEAFGKRHAVVFTTGHQANLALVAGLCGPDDAVVLDAECHASLFDGARLSGADLHLFRHGDAADLDRKLARLDRPALVCVEGLYSISGELAPLPEIVAVCRGRARLLVDEAHGFGGFGARGLGVAELQGVLGEVDLLTGTFSKALGGVGGFAVSDHDALPLLRVVARSYVFTASGTPATVAAAREALRRITDPVAGPALRERLSANTRRLRERLGVPASASPIVPVPVGGLERTVRAWQGALERGVYVNLVLPPACRQGAERLRASVSAAHTDDEIDQGAAAIALAVEDACRSSS